MIHMNISLTLPTQKLMGIVKREISKIALFREGDGLMTLLSFSMICLVAAEHSNAQKKDHFLKLALSVILPMVRRKRVFLYSMLHYYG